MKVTDYQDFTTIDMPKEEREKLHVGDIWANQIQCAKCGELIRSKNRHDFRMCKCGACGVDGGSVYLKRTGNSEDWVERYILYNDVI